MTSDTLDQEESPVGVYSEMFGIRIRSASLEQAVAAADDAIATDHRHHIGVVNASKIVNMRRNSELKASVLDSDVVYADGMSVVWASRLLGSALPERVAGIDLMHGILRRGDLCGYRVYCLGASQEVLAKTCAEFRKQYPGAKIVGSHDGYFSEAEEKAVAEAIRAADADVLFVAITSPKKENFMARWGEYCNVPVVHGVGGSFDVVAGLVERAPEGWQRFGMEWLYRVKQEPGRLWKRYLVTNTYFGCMLIGSLVRRLLGVGRP